MIAATYAPTFRDLVDGVLLQMRQVAFRLPTRILGFMLLLFWFLHLPRTRTEDFTLLYISLPFVAGLMAFGDYICAYFAAFAGRGAAVGKTVVFRFSDEDYSIQSPGAETTIAWDSVMHVLYAKKGFLICRTQHSGLWLPHRIFGGSVDEFCLLLKNAQVKIKKV